LKLCGKLGNNNESTNIFIVLKTNIYNKMVGISLVVILILVITGIVVISMSHLKHKFFIFFLILIALFLYSTMILVTKQNSLDFSSPKGVFNAIKVYTGWLVNGYHNMKDITGKAIKMDWASTNKTQNEK